MNTWLVVAAERRELDGVLKRWGACSKLDWPEARHAFEAHARGDRWLLVANGPGPRLVQQALARRMNVSGLKTDTIGPTVNLAGVISTGFCGALDPALQVGDIVVGGDSPVQSNRPFVRGEILSRDRVAVTSAEKAAIRAKTGAVAVEMESAAVALKAAEWGVPFFCVRAVSDTAADNLPLDFNLFRDAEGRFSRGRIALAAMARPFSVMPGLLDLDRSSRRAAEALGEFLADCRF